MKNVYYSSEQVANLLTEIKSKIPSNVYYGNRVRKFIDAKIDNIDKHI